jgi:SpoVK/Ycf46/Vps4 family AAA+-type ATPase
MRKGFACLFYGAPGTGKTETVLQLARKCGRDIMQVNISTIKSKWVGESEKNIKAIFDRYRTAVQQSEIAPILLFNEADAIISKRMSNAQRSVDKMDNAIQNIILEEMEKLEGILIATTNLAGNMDSAFERRFIYKIEFKNPSVDAKMSIWKSMIPALNDEMAYILAQKYDFSGGQIENIARKHTVEYVLTGKNADIDNLTQICDSEQLNKRSNRPIGY